MYIHSRKTSLHRCIKNSPQKKYLGDFGVFGSGVLSRGAIVSSRKTKRGRKKKTTPWKSTIRLGGGKPPFPGHPGGRRIIAGWKTR